MSTITSAAVSSPGPMTNAQLDQLSINCIRTLSMDAVQQAKSGHPGTPMALAPLVYTLWNRVMRFDPQDPIWPNRDRFVLSNGHASMLLWSVLHLTGTRAVNAEYERLGQPAVSLDDIRHFRQLNSKAPGHPEYHWVSGVEATTGPLGQGIAMSVGMAIAEKWLANRYNRPSYEIFDYNIYAVCGDGCMMEGVGSEAASLAGHLALDNLCWIYDNNHITIEGSTRITFTEDIAARFLGYGWNVLRVGDANDIDRIEHALDIFRKTKGRPTFIILDSHIGYGSPHKQDTAAAHGEPLGEEEIRLAKRDYGWPEDAKFLVPDAVRDHFAAGIGTRGPQARGRWTELFTTYRSVYPELATEIDLMQRRELPAGWDAGLPIFPADPKGIAGRDASGRVLNVLAQNVPWLLGGSADLGPSTKTTLAFEGAGDFEPGTPGGRNLHFGIREHAMAAVVNGLSLSKLRAFGATFFIFSDYARPAIRLSALMELPTIFVFTHDAMGDGEDGPTHQPVEQLASFRADPGLGHAAARGRQRGRGGLPLYHQAATRAGSPGVIAPTPANFGPQQVRGRFWGCARRLCARRRSRWQTRSDPDRVRQRGQPLRSGARGTARRGHPLARGLDAVLGYFRTPDTGVSGQRAAARCDGARGSRGGIDPWLGTLRGQVRPHHRDEDIRRVSPAQGTPTKIRLRAGACDGNRERTAWQGQEKLKRYPAYRLRRKSRAIRVGIAENQGGFGRRASGGGGPLRMMNGPASSDEAPRRRR